MKEEINGGTFASKEEKVVANQETENKFISGEPSMITTDEVFALLGEQMVRAKNWAKIALAWNRNFNALKEKSKDINLQIALLDKQNKELKDSNSSYVISNKSLDKRITDLNALIKENNSKAVLGDKTYMELNFKYRKLEEQNQDLKTQVDSLTEENVNLKSIKEEDEKEKVRLKEKISIGSTKSKKRKVV